MDADRLLCETIHSYHARKLGAECVNEHMLLLPCDVVEATKKILSETCSEVNAFADDCPSPWST
jgi:hypothetical protein